MAPRDDAVSVSGPVEGAERVSDGLTAPGGSRATSDRSEASDARSSDREPVNRPEAATSARVSAPQPSVGAQPHPSPADAADGHAADFDACGRACRRRRAHTYRWGTCAHAAEPEPTVSISRMFTAADGYPSIGFDRYTAAQLADRIEPALREVRIRIGLDGGEYAALALAAAQVLIDNAQPKGTAP